MSETEFEHRLRQALRHEDPPPGFSARVMARLLEGKPQPLIHWWQRTWWQRTVVRWALAGSLASLMAVATGIGVYQHQQRKRGEEARDQLMLALQITHTEFDRVGHILSEK